MQQEKSMNLAIVTGGSRGLGKALVDRYMAGDWSVLEFSRSGTGLHHVPVDLADLSASFGVLNKQFQILAKTAWEKVVFINNAGILAPIAPVHALTDAQIEQNIAVNLVSCIRIVSAFVRSFQDSECRVTITNISSGAALKGYAGWPLYCAAKAGMENYMLALAAEQNTSANPMTCINIEPGVIDTGMQEEIRQTDPANFPDVAHFIELKKSGHLRSPKAVAQAIMHIIDSNPDNGGRYRIADHALTADMMGQSQAT
ncbi:MAG: SDR family NAD(P)-dependent oxidoreductase [Burkholderiales bacterium]